MTEYVIEDVCLDKDGNIIPEDLIGHNDPSNSDSYKETYDQGDDGDDVDYSSALFKVYDDGRREVIAIDDDLESLEQRKAELEAEESDDSEDLV